ncbi:MAG: CDP-glycerol glycerophosphotransferase family protein [Oscillospiraceae bacterium]|nr:CDP-glycerol glycerophosphotransferase family protein [Oscillospiraceae bacterium]
MRLYIDPGTGSMLFTILIGLIGAAIYSVRMFAIKIRYLIGGGKVETNNKKTPFVIYSDDKRYWNIFEPICKEMDKRGKDILYLTASKDDPVFSCGYPHIKAECIGKDNSSFTRLNFLNASIVLSTTPGLNVYQWKRSKDVDFYVHIPHAASDITMYRMFGIDYYDAILLSGQYQCDDVRELEKMRSLPAKELVKVGIPYMDVMAQRFEKAGEAEKHERTVLLAPTWGPSALFSVYGSDILDVILKTGYHVIVRPHPQSFESEKELMDKLMQKYPNSEQLEWNRDNDNFEVLRRSDILISDFSGVIFDFSLIYSKPVIYTDPNFDLAPYDAWWLKRDPWTISALSKIGQQLTEENMKNLKELIDTCIEDDRFSKGIREIRDETWENVGKGAENVADYLISKYEEITSGKEKQ